MSGSRECQCFPGIFRDSGDFRPASMPEESPGHLRVPGLFFCYQRSQGIRGSARKVGRRRNPEWIPGLLLSGRRQTGNWLRGGWGLGRRFFGVQGFTPSRSGRDEVAISIDCALNRGGPGVGVGVAMSNDKPAASRR